MTTDWIRAVRALLPADGTESEAHRSERIRRALVQPALQLELRTDDPDRPPLLLDR